MKRIRFRYLIGEPLFTLRLKSIVYKSTFKFIRNFIKLKISQQFRLFSRFLKSFFFLNSLSKHLFL